MIGRFFQVLDEQTSMGFTGRINFLEEENSRLLGHVELLQGEIINACFKSAHGFQAFVSICAEAFDANRQFREVVEPEVIESKRTIHFPYSVLKRKTAEILKDYEENKNFRPPDELKLLINPEFIREGESVKEDEHILLCSLADFNTVKEIYKNCDLLDYQITNALVSLRKKKAIMVVK